MIKVQNLTKTYKYTNALDQVSITFPDHGVVGVLGPNGSGKTTLFNTITKLARANQGKVTVRDEVLLDCRTHGKETILPQKIISYIPDFQKYYPLKVEDLVTIYTLIHDDFLLENFVELLDAFKINKKAKIKRLSKGQKACLGLALTLSRDVNCYILDEPFDGIDIEIRDNIIQNLVKYVDPNNKLLLIASHEVHEIERIMDRFLYLDNGHIKHNISVSDIREQYGMSLTSWLLKEMEGDFYE